MKHFFVTFLFVMAFMPIHAQKSAMYGVVRLSHTEIADSLYRITSALEKVEKELNSRNNGSLKLKDGYYYTGIDKAIDSLYNLKWNLTSQRTQLLSTQENQLGLDAHLMNAGKYVCKAYTLELVGIAFGIAGGVGLGTGIAKDKTAIKVTGIVTCAASFGCLIGAYTCHFKSGQKLRLAANSITYSF